MANYRRYRTETLLKMRDAAYEKYMTEATKPDEGWGAGMRRSKLCDYKGWARAKDRYEAIETELARRRDSQAGA